jgi:hypothetical protein
LPVKFALEIGFGQARRHAEMLGEPEQVVDVEKLKLTRSWPFMARARPIPWV